MYNSTIGLVFFSTPFRGTDKDFTMGCLMECAEKLHKTVYKQNYEIFRPGDDNLLDVVDGFLRTTRDDAKPKILCFFERKETDIGRFLSDGPDSNRTFDGEVRHSPCWYLALAHSSLVISRTCG